MKYNLDFSKFRTLKDGNFTLNVGNFHSYQKAIYQQIKQLEELNNSVGKTSDAYRIAENQVRAHVTKGLPIQSILNSRLHIRSLCTLLSQDNFSKRHPLTNEALNHIKNNSDRPSTLLVTAISSYFFYYFDDIPNQNELANWICWARSKRLEYNQNDRYIFAKSGPSWIAQRAIKKQIQLPEVLEELQIKELAKGRFYQISQATFYVKRLRKIPVNCSHKLLEKVSDPDIYNAQYEAGTRLGHKVLEILIDRAAQAKISELDESWKQTILKIAKDPRTAKNSQNYRRWWLPIGNERIHKMRGWLSRYDLKLFLVALENISQQEGGNMLRMYPARKQFLEGLFNQDLVQNSRLFVGSKIDTYLRRNILHEDLPEYGIINEYKGLIYLDLGDVHIMEGTHSCYFWIFPRLREDAPIFDYGRNHFSYHNLTQGLTFYANSGHFKQVHHPHLKWQAEVLQELRKYGIIISPEKVIPAEDLQSYRWNYGV